MSTAVKGMTIEQAFLRSTYLLVTIGFVALFVTEQVSPEIMLLIPLAILYSYWSEGRAKMITLPTPVWNALTILVFLYECYLAIYTPRELILGVTEFLIFLQVVRLCSKKGDRDYLQMYGLSLLHLIAATVLTADLIFALVFFVYILTGTWALVAFNIHREARLAVAHAQERFFSGWFFLTLVGVALAVVVFSTIIFMVFPRFNYSYFAPILSKPAAQSGFTEQVKLGQMGSIKLDQRPVMRVSISGSAAHKLKAEHLYLRGVTLDRYDGESWKPLVKREGSETLSVQTSQFVAILRHSQEEADIDLDIVLEPIGQDVLFVLPEVIGLQTPPGVVTHRQGENFAGTFAGTQRMKYRVYSKLQSTNERELLRKSQTPIAPEKFREYLQIPDGLDPRIAKLAREAAGGAATPYAKAQRVDAYLRSRLKYSLKMGDPGGQDPLAAFLFDRKEGHCEYFASAMTVMLRTLGIPSRMVGGYYHGEWNEVGQFFLVRESHAHTWVEVFVPDGGWVPFDPTPVDPMRPENSGVWNYAQQWLESAQLLWLNWVVDYDLQQQRKAARQLSFGNRTHTPVVQKKASPQSRRFNAFADRMPGAVGVVLLGAAALAVGYGILRAAKSMLQKKTGASFLFYEKMLVLLAHYGLKRKPEQTPLEFSKQVSRQCAPAAPIVGELTDIFCRLKYGEDSRPPPNVKTQALLRQLKSALKSQRVY